MVNFLYGLQQNYKYKMNARDIEDEESRIPKMNITKDRI
jgi:hypothetical protein